MNGPSVQEINIVSKHKSVSYEVINVYIKESERTDLSSLKCWLSINLLIYPSSYFPTILTEWYHQINTREMQEKLWMFLIKDQNQVNQHILYQLVLSALHIL